ncbi:hypothetical protein [Zhihengliuella alba]|uniref:hypothetical protein n=1 Tax=Zhihengliuella alba TaxID=547018 RepID=UPI0031E5E324
MRRAQEEARRASDEPAPAEGTEQGAAVDSAASAPGPGDRAKAAPSGPDAPPVAPKPSKPSSRTPEASTAPGSNPSASPGSSGAETVAAGGDPSPAEPGQRSTASRGKRAAALQSTEEAPSSRAAEEETTAERVQRANRSRRAAEAPVDAIPPRSERTERSSLQRARDREALRRRRAAEEASAQPKPSEDEAAPLTRRQLRLQALAAAKAASGREGSSAAAEAPEVASAEEAAHLDTAPNPVAGAALPNKSASTPAESGRPDGAAGKTDAEMSVEEALRARRAARPPKSPAGSAGTPAGQRVRPRTTPASSPDGGVGAAKGAVPASEDTGLVDLETLATQRERAARAAIINRRIAERRRLEAENAQRLNQVSADPFTGAMNQFVDPEAEKRLVNTGISGPPTSGVELDLSAAGDPREGPRGPRRSTKPVPHGGATAEQLRETAERHGAPADPARRDEAPAGAEASDEAAVQPLAATSAQGLDPLDSVTAGIRRANQWFYVSFGALAVGVGTFVAGIIMIVNSN